MQPKQDGSQGNMVKSLTVKTPSTLYLSQETAMGQLTITKGVNGQTGTEVKFFLLKERREEEKEVKRKAECGGRGAESE